MTGEGKEQDYLDSLLSGNPAPIPEPKANGAIPLPVDSEPTYLERPIAYPTPVEIPLVTPIDGFIGQPPIEVRRDKKPGKGRKIATAVIVTVVVLGALGTTGAIFGPQIIEDMASQSGSNPQAPTESKTVTLPGWSGTANWSHDIGKTQGIVASSDGAYIAYLTDAYAPVVLDSNTGEPVTESATPFEASRVLSVRVDDKAGFIFFSSEQYATWVPGSEEFVIRDNLPDADITIRNGSAVMTSPAGSYLIRSADPTPIVPPKPGASFLSVLKDSRALWVGTGGKFIVSSYEGRVIQEGTIAAPAEGYTLNQWVANSDDVLLSTWKAPDGSNNLATHLIADSSSAGYQPIADESDRLSRGQDLRSALYGNIVIDMVGGKLTVPSGTFLRVADLGPYFYGTVGGVPNLLTDLGELKEVKQPQITPLSLSSDDSLITYTSGELSAYPYEGS